MDNNVSIDPNLGDSPTIDPAFNSFQQTPPTTPNPTDGMANQQPPNAKPDSSTVIVCVLCILFPILGALGIHDFVVGRKKEGKKHIIYTASGFLGLFMTMSIMFCDNGSNCAGAIGNIIGFVSILGMVLYILPFASYIWGIVECIQIFTGKYQKNNNQEV